MYVKIEQGQVVQYPYSLLALQADHPNVSFPQSWPASVLASYGVAAVLTAEQPATDHTKVAVEKTPRCVGGVWTQVWEVVDASPALLAERTQDAAQTVRTRRDALLNSTVDSLNPLQWEQMTEAQRTAWKDFRQALLDITEQSGFPFSVVWPTKPV